VPERGELTACWDSELREGFLDLAVDGIGGHRVSRQGCHQRNIFLALVTVMLFDTSVDAPDARIPACVSLCATTVSKATIAR
jgi:hypothetical protein